MGYILGYNPFANHLLTSWDIQEDVGKKQQVLIWAVIKALGVLLHIGDDTAHLYMDSDKPV